MELTQNDKIMVQVERNQWSNYTVQRKSTLLLQSSVKTSSAVKKEKKKKAELNGERGGKQGHRLLQADMGTGSELPFPSL